MDDNDPGTIESVEDPARRLNDLAVPASFTQFPRTGSTFRMLCQLRDMVANPPNQATGRQRILQGNEVCYRFKVGQRRLRPDYFSHLPRRLPASA